MIFIKGILSILIVFCSTLLGIELAKKYVYRERQLYEIKNALKIMETKIRYTYEPLKEIFEELSKTLDGAVSDIFLIAKENIDSMPAKETWENAVDNARLLINKEDTEILKDFGKLLGKTDKLGQISEIELSVSMIDKQIGQAIKEREKNENLYKKLGLIFRVNDCYYSYLIMIGEKEWI